MLTTKIQKIHPHQLSKPPKSVGQLVPRRAQNYLVAEIAKTLCGQYHKSNRMIVAEAGTGIGKSLAYLMAAIPVAVLNRKIVISTATVALQEQLVNKDLPLYRRLTDREFSFILATKVDSVTVVLKN